MLRMAILGMGWAGTRHVQAIRELGGSATDIACIVDNDEAYLEAKGDELGIERQYTDYRAALADPEVDAVSICLPHALHCPVALEAASAGKHILCEKPIALSVSDATSMMEAARQHGVKLYVAENVAYTPMARYLRDIVANQSMIGNLTFANVVEGFRGLDYGYPGRRSWLSTPERGGTGTWMLHGIHSVARLRYILGEVESIYMQQHRSNAFNRPDLEATMSGLLKLASGIHVSITQTCETYLGTRKGYFLYGTCGTIHATQDGGEVTLDTGETQALRYTHEQLSSYALEMQAFADYVSQGIIGPTTGESERRSLAVVQAGYESARFGQPINLRERFGSL
jgi:predicted dehydrogenase